MKKLLFSLVLGAFFVFTFCVNNLLAEKLIAQVGEYKLYDTDLEELIKGDLQIRELLKTKPELKTQIEKSLIERWLNITMLSLAAKEAKLNENLEVKKKLISAENMILAEEYLQRKLSQIVITEEEAKEYYTKHKENYLEPEAVQLKHILIYVPANADKQIKEKALQKAKQIRAQLLKGAKFEELAKIHSDDTASKDKGGDLGILKKGETLPEFEVEVFKLKVGEISEPILSPYGYHIVRVTKKIPALQLPYEKIEERVREDLKREKERAFLEKQLEELRQKYAPQIF